MKNLYAIYDTLAEEAGPVFEAVNDLVARRAYDALTSEMSSSKETFVLHCIGSIDGLELVSNIRIIDEVPENA